MVTRKRVVVGAHYGWRDWLVQRVSAVVMALYTLLVLVLLCGTAVSTTPRGRRRSRASAFRLATFVFMLVAAVARVGRRAQHRDGLLEAGRACASRFEVVVIVLLIGYVGWTIQVLWGR